MSDLGDSQPAGCIQKQTWKTYLILCDLSGDQVSVFFWVKANDVSSTLMAATHQLSLAPNEKILL